MPTEMRNLTADVIVVGGGLAGLACAATAARDGRSVILLEKSSRAGGRAATQDDHGFQFNLGPHALYRGGAAARVLADLKIPLTGNVPVGGRRVVRHGRLHQFPAGLSALLRTTALPLRARLAAARFMAGLAQIDPAPLNDVTVGEWLDGSLPNRDAQALLLTLIRLSTYANDPERQSAGAAIAQLQLGARGVWYVDGGWQKLVEGLRQAAMRAGAVILESQRVAKALIRNAAVEGVLLAEGESCRARHVVLATGPAEASAMLAHAVPAIARAATEARPARAACLDVGLSRLPNGKNLFALGLDDPLYFSVHSEWAQLAPSGGAVIQVARYLRPDEKLDPAEVRRQLEHLLDLMQPGWRDVLVTSRFLPGLTVVPAVDLAANGGVPGRPGPAVAEVESLYVAGDWVGSEGMLADAALASGWRAARLIAAAERTAEEPADVVA